VTHVVNSMVNRVGATFVHRLMESNRAKPDQIVRSYLATREVFGYVDLWQRIEALDNRVSDATQAEMTNELGRLGARATVWFLRSRRLKESMEQVFARFRPAVAVLRERVSLSPEQTQRVQGWVSAGVPADLAQAVAGADALYAALDVAEIADTTQQPLADVAEIHARVAERLGLPRLRQQIDSLPAESFWQTQAKAALSDDLDSLQRQIAHDVLQQAPGSDTADKLTVWEYRDHAAIERAQRLLGEFREAKVVDMAMLTVALRELRNLG